MKRLKVILGILPFVLAAATQAQTWTNTNSMMTARYGQTATLLQSGQVLVAGGRDSTGFFASAELYDPGIGAWLPGGNMSSPRFGAAAVLLPSGKVLVAGGCNSNCTVAQPTVDLYDPGTNTWSPTGSMLSPRYFFTATLLQNGTVLAAGGCNIGNCGTVTSSSETYDSASGKWSLVGKLSAARDYHTATLLPSGKVLVAGGYGVSGVTSSAELFDPVTSTYSSAGTMVYALAQSTATLLPTGKVLIAGGSVSLPVKVAELYDPANGAWTATGSMTNSRAGHAASLLTSGLVLVAGGTSFVRPKYIKLASCELYDPATGTWSSTTSLNTARTQHAATLLNNGHVLAAGGVGTFSVLSSAEIYSGP
jgi:hypothetical protein